MGGGGEGGFGSGIAGIEAEKVFGVGITTVVGLLGADGFTKSVEGLYAKAKALETGGLSTYIYCGSYTLPPATITGSVIRDLIFIDKVIGVKIALSDHRSSHPDKTELTKIACEAHLGGMLSGKAGVTHIHIGDGRGGLSPLFELLESCDLPKRRFVPTHLNRSRRVFEQAKRYCKSGGNIDLTAGETTGIPVPDAVSELVNKKIDLDSVTVSSDANGSTPDGARAIHEFIQDIWTAYGKNNPARNRFQPCNRKPRQNIGAVRRKRAACGQGGRGYSDNRQGF